MNQIQEMLRDEFEDYLSYSNYKGLHIELFRSTQGTLHVAVFLLFKWYKIQVMIEVSILVLKNFEQMISTTFGSNI